MAGKPVNLLLVVANAQHAEAIAAHISRLGGADVEIKSCGTLECAVEHLDRGKTGVVLLDALLPDQSGIDAVRSLSKLDRQLPIVVLVEETDRETIHAYMRAGASDVLKKGKVSPEGMLRALWAAIERSEISCQSPMDVAVRETAESIRAIINASMDCIITMNADGRIVQFNRAAERTFGYKAAEVMGQDLGQLFLPPDVRERQKRSFELYQAGGGGSMLGKRVETPAYRKDGGEFTAEMATQPVRMDGGLVFTIFLRDITDRKMAEEKLRHEVKRRRRTEDALRRERDLLIAVMDNVPDLIFAKDKQERFITVNRTLLKAMGSKKLDEVVGKTDLDFFPKNQAQQYIDDDQAVMKSGKPLVNREEMAPDPDGNTRWALTTKVPLRDREGRVEGIVGISRDITDRKKAEEELRKAKEEAEDANRAKSAFLANMSHEIRTPMNAVIGMTELLLDMDLTHSQREYIAMVHDSGEALLALINDILDFSKIEAGKLEFERNEFPLRDSLASMMKTLALRAHKKHLELAFHIDPDVPDTLVGDVNRLRQVIVNLVGNGIKFTESGEVILAVSCKSVANDTASLQFSVRDTGIGISDVQQKRIFDAFEQADTSTTRRFGGTGLGLAISMRLVEMMQGQISVESKVDQGSTFHFSAQFGIGTDSAILRAVPSDVANLPVLVVDDNKTNRIILRDMLSNLNMHPTLASSATEAITSLRESEVSGNPFGLIITDMHMPQMDGLELVKHLRQDEAFQETRVILLTSGMRDGDLEHARSVGVNLHLMKPISQSELFDAIIRVLGQKEKTPVAGHRSVDELLSTQRALRVLLAEDSLVNQKLAIGLLSKVGHDVTVATNGKEAVELATKSRFDVVLMDLQMPEIDGLEATRRIRRAPDTNIAETPIIAMTAHAMTGDRELCLEAGMDDYIPKPIRSQVLYEKLAKIEPTTSSSELPSA